MYRVRVGPAAPPLVLFLTHIYCRDLLTLFLSGHSSGGSRFHRLHLFKSHFFLYLFPPFSKAGFAFGVCCFSCALLLPFFCLLAPY